MDKIGFIYENETIINLGNGRFVLKKGMILKTNKEVFDQSDIHYFKNNPKKIDKDEEVEIIGCWMNFYGSYISCKYNNKKFDIKPEDLNYIK